MNGHQAPHDDTPSYVKRTEHNVLGLWFRPEQEWLVLEVKGVGVGDPEADQEFSYEVGVRPAASELGAQGQADCEHSLPRNLCTVCTPDDQQLPWRAE